MPDSQKLQKCCFVDDFHVRKRVYTEVFLTRETKNLNREESPDVEKQVLLGRKKRGFKAGLYFGYGGKVEPSDASIADAAVRELEEESGLKVSSQDLREVGVVYVQFADLKCLEIHAFCGSLSRNGSIGSATSRRSGGSVSSEAASHEKSANIINARCDPIETEEMAPEWFPIHRIPWEKCLPDVRQWYPLAIAGRPFQAEFILGKGDIVVEESVAMCDSSSSV